MKNVICSLLALPLAAFAQTALTTAQIAKRASPSVVVIQGKTDTGDVLGSGFIVSEDGKIVTNLHVIREMKTASVELANGDTFDSVSVLATDERRDLAVVKIPGFDLAVLDLGNSDTVIVGEPVVIVGSPRGLEGTVTAGILSSMRDAGDGFKVLQTDAAVNPGNSGGPLVNNKGQAIGVVSFKLRSSEGLNFAVPINYVRGMLSNLHEPTSLEHMRGSLVDLSSVVQQNSAPRPEWSTERMLGLQRYHRGKERRTGRFSLSPELRDWPMLGNVQRALEFRAYGGAQH
jgi:S1-C subfamily serine protease